ncbi:MAG TPA: 4-vinyl reductase [Candidatus Thermoplasmatota archaeon]|nr:4-vinyl reductase [Candidatus Thermoplasmatota archaeon]
MILPTPSGPLLAVAAIFALFAMLLVAMAVTARKPRASRDPAYPRIDPALLKASEAERKAARDAGARRGRSDAPASLDETLELLERHTSSRASHSHETGRIVIGLDRMRVHDHADCAFAEGYLETALGRLARSSALVVRERACAALGDGTCVFHVEPPSEEGDGLRDVEFQVVQNRARRDDRAVSQEASREPRAAADARSGADDASVEDRSSVHTRVL